jgi:hypothetical protein
MLEATHLTTLVQQRVSRVDLPPFLQEVGHLDQLLAVWEWRERPTPWLLAASRERPGSAFWNSVKESMPPSRP